MKRQALRIHVYVIQPDGSNWLLLYTGVTDNKPRLNKNYGDVLLGCNFFHIKKSGARYYISCPYGGVE